jgi:hypothetical protein
MTEVLTIDEINERHPDEWILIGEPETSESQEVLRGKVLYHGKSRDEMYQAAKDLPAPKYFATHYTGEFPADMVVVL